MSEKGIDNISTLKGFTNILLIIDNKSKLIDFLNNIKTENLTNNLTNFYQFIKKVIESQILNQYSDDEKINMIKLLSEKNIDDKYVLTKLFHIKSNIDNKAKLIDFLNNIETKNLTNINEFIKKVFNSGILHAYSDDQKITIIKLLNEKGINDQVALNALTLIQNDINDKSKLIDFLNNIETKNLTNINEFIKKVFNSGILHAYSDDQKITIIKLLNEKGINDQVALNALTLIQNDINDKSKLIDFLNNIETKNLTNINEFIEKVYNSKILNAYSDDQKITIIKLLSEKGIDNINFLKDLNNKSFESIIGNVKSFLSLDNLIKIQNEEIFNLISYEDPNLNNKNFNCDNI